MSFEKPKFNKPEKKEVKEGEIIRAEKPKWQWRLEKKMSWEKRLEDELAALQARLKHLEQKSKTKVNDRKISETRIAIQEQQEKIQRFKESESKIREGDFLREI